MEGLIAIVAASFARHGIDCPDAASRPVERAMVPTPASTTMPAEPTALPEHSFRRKSEGDPAP
jgi:hypothetical protein